MTSKATPKEEVKATVVVSSNEELSSKAVTEGGSHWKAPHLSSEVTSNYQHRSDQRPNISPELDQKHDGQKLKAVKSDGTAIQIHLWNDQVMARLGIQFK